MSPIHPATGIPTSSVMRYRDPVHAAVDKKDSDQIFKARREGNRANVLDDERRSPMDHLDALRDIDERSRSSLRSALLQSLNPTAPRGYMKPEALHGSPWGVEILASGALKGGVNDAKGGSQSLNGQVFFSDRTPERFTDDTTRQNLRGKARTYSRGKGLTSSTAESRAQQHRLTQIMLQSLGSGMQLSFSPVNPTLDLKSPQAIKEEGADWLQNYLHAAFILRGTARLWLDAPLEQSTKELKLPQTITLTFENGTSQILRGNELTSFYKQAASDLCARLEGGKAPYLALLNQGTVVPIVFGFEKVNNLSTHAISSGVLAPRLYSYQQQSHPLDGSPSGGKLKEIEVRSLADLATLCLGCAIKGARLPESVLIRLKGARSDKAEYLSPAQVKQFQLQVLALAEASDPGDSSLPFDSRALSDFQQINTALRKEDFRAYF
ncbi:unnamed protein product [Ectocarpus sp. 12 AP-2014]